MSYKKFCIITNLPPGVDHFFQTIQFITVCHKIFCLAFLRKMKKQGNLAMLIKMKETYCSSIFRNVDNEYKINFIEHKLILDL